MTPMQPIKITNPNIELRRCGVKAGMVFSASQDLKGKGWWFTAPDRTECVIYEGDFEFELKPLKVN